MEIDGRTVVAIVYNDDGTVYDHCWTWETGQTFALEGYRVQAIADDGTYWTQERAQALYDADRERYNDCYGVN